MHIDQQQPEEVTPKVEEDFFADCENNSNDALSSGALFAGDSEGSRPVVAAKVWWPIDLPFPA